MRRALVLALLGAIAAPGAAYARVPVRVESVVRPDTVLVGQTVTLQWRTFLPEGSQLNFPAKPADDSTTHWVSWDVATLAGKKGGLREHRLTAKLQSFALGPVAVPGPSIRFRVPGEDVRAGRFPTAQFTVGMTVPRSGPEPPLRDMKALVPPPWWALVPWLWIGALLAAALIAWWAIRRWLAARRKRGTAAAPEPELEAPEIEARRRLSALVARNLPEAQRTLEHGTELADLLRRYVERRFETPRPGYTTSELVRHLAGRAGTSDADLAQLRGILEACDLTKFARRPYDVTRAHEAERTAGLLIDAWTPRPAAVPAPATGTTGAAP